MRLIIAALLTVVLAACATPSPFIDGDSKWQEEGATAGNDAERKLGVGYVATKYLKQGNRDVRRGNINRLADLLEATAGEGATGRILNDALNELVNRQDLEPEDILLAQYLVDKLTSYVDLDIPLSPERRRVVGVYVQALRDAATVS